MKDYSKMSDAEIAMRVACSIEGVDVDDGGIPKFAVDCYLYNSANSIKWLRVGDDEFELFNPCNNPSDAWPLIESNLICLMADVFCEPQDGGKWIAQPAYGWQHERVRNDNPLRAAMIVYLMMKDEEQ